MNNIPSLPKLAKGGVVHKSNMVGYPTEEDFSPEIVIPLSIDLEELKKLINEWYRSTH